MAILRVKWKSYMKSASFYLGRDKTFGNHGNV